jgi:peptide chain release factor 1
LIVEIKSGEGGDDSKLFVHDLVSAYAKYAKSLKFKTEILTSGYGYATLKVIGKGVWKAFQHESGVHCVQRVPPTESKGRRQTSYLSVAVLDLPPEKTQTPLPDKDVNIKAVNIGGPGGQHQNKTESAIRMTHKPTGFQVLINGRDQHSNKREARKILTAKVNQLKNSQKKADYNADRAKQRGTGGRGDKIRTYNFLESRVADHKTGKKTKNIKGVMRGDFSFLKK